MSSRPTEPSAQACAAASLTFVIKLGGAGDPPDVGTGAVTVGEGETPVVEVTEAVSQDATNSAMATVGTIHLADSAPQGEVASGICSGGIARGQFVTTTDGSSTFGACSRAMT